MPSEDERIKMIEEEELPALKEELAELGNSIQAFQQGGYSVGLSPSLVLAMPSLGTAAAVFAGFPFPTVYQEMKTFGSGAKQAAQVGFSPKGNLKTKTSKTCVSYEAKKPDRTGRRDVTVTITHSDGTKQEWLLMHAQGNPPPPAQPAKRTLKVVMCYDAAGNPTSIYIT